MIRATKRISAIQQVRVNRIIPNWIFTAVMKARLKTYKLPSISVLLAAVLLACSPSGKSSSPTQKTDQNPAGSVATMTLPFDATQAPIAINTPPYTAPIVIASPISAPIPAHTPFLSAYNFTCALAAGGGIMTMNLAWIDHSNDEEGYRVYRDGRVIATLAPNSIFYADVAFVAAGKTLSYAVEAFSKDWQASTRTINYGCQ